MTHRQDINSILALVAPWPEAERMALAYSILQDARGKQRSPAPRNTLARGLGVAAGAMSPPDDATVDRWVEEHRLRKHG